MSECSKTVIPLRNNAMSKIVGPLGSRPMTTTLTKKQLHNSRTFFLHNDHLFNEHPYQIWPKWHPENHNENILSFIDVESFIFKRLNVYRKSFWYHEAQVYCRFAWHISWPVKLECFSSQRWWLVMIKSRDVNHNFLVMWITGIDTSPRLDLTLFYKNNESAPILWFIPNTHVSMTDFI